MMEDEDDDHVPFKDIPETQDDEFARTVAIRDAARRAFVTVDTDKRLRRAAVAASRPSRLTFQPGDLCYFYREQVGWSPGMATVVSQVGQGHYYIDYGGRVFKVAAEQISPISERERAARRAVEEAEGPADEQGMDTPVDDGSGVAPRTPGAVPGTSGRDDADASWWRQFEPFDPEGDVSMGAPAARPSQEEEAQPSVEPEAAAVPVPDDADASWWRQFDPFDPK